MLFVSIELLIACLALLWLPPILAAHFFTRSGERLAQKSLLIILPIQFALAYLFSHAGQAVGLSNLSQTFVMTTLALSVVGVLATLLVHQLEQF